MSEADHFIPGKYEKIDGLQIIKGMAPWQIVENVMEFMSEFEAYTRDGYLKPYWSKVALDSEEELRRLETSRPAVRRFFNNVCGEIFFIGYSEKPEGRTDIWFLPMISSVLEVYPERPSLYPSEITFEFKYDPDVLASWKEG